MVDVRDRLVEAGDHLDREDGRQVFGEVILIAGRHSGRHQGLRLRTATDFDAFVGQHRADRRQQLGGARTRHQQRLSGVAGAVALRLGVLDDGQSLRRIGGFVEVHMAVAVEVLDHRHTGFGKQARDQPLTAARHDHIDVLAHGDELADRGPVGGVDHLHHLGRQTGAGQRFLDQRGDRAIAANGLGAAAQDRGIARFKAQRRRVGGHVRTRFVDDADNAQRHAHFSDLDAARAELELADFADRIGQSGDLFNAFSHRLDALLAQGEAVEQSGLQPCGPCCGNILGIRGEQGRAFAPDCCRQGQQSGIFNARIGTGDGTRGGTGLGADTAHVVFDVHGADGTPDRGRGSLEWIIMIKQNP